MSTIKHFLGNLYSSIHLTTPRAILLGACILAISHLGYGTLLTRNGAALENEIFKGRIIDESDLATGNTKSDIVVVEYSDTECPFCAQFHPTIKKMQDEYGSKISFVYRYFPLTQIHPHAFEEARALYCAGKVGGSKKREAYIHEIFTSKIAKKNMVLPEGGKEALASNVGLDVSAMSACMKSQESSDAINASIQDGVQAGVDGTPATYVLIKKGKGYEVVSMIAGARPYEYFKAVLDEALAR